MPTIDEDDLITWAHKEPTVNDFYNIRLLTIDLSSAAFLDDTKTAREKALLIVGLLWPATD